MRRSALATGFLFSLLLLAEPASALVVRPVRAPSHPVHRRLLQRPSRRSVRKHAERQRLSVPVLAVSSSSAASRSSASAGAGLFAAIDPLPAAAVTSNVLLLEEVSVPIAGVKFYSTSEAIKADSIRIQLTADVPTVESMLIYNEERRLLGVAAQEAGTAGRYVLRLSRGMFTLPHKKSVSLYVRARLKSYDYGGESGQTVQVSTVDVVGTGEWSNTEYIQSSTETFPGFETARGAPVVIRNAGVADAALGAGNGQLLAQFRFEGRETDGEAQVRLTQLTFTIESGGGVTVSNPVLRVEGSDTAHACSVSAPLITCSSIPVTHGSLESPRVLRVYGDVAIAAGSTNAFLRLTLNDPGSVSSTGHISWTDGSATFTWVPFEQPVARGTMFR